MKRDNQYERVDPQSGGVVAPNKPAKKQSALLSYLHNDKISRGLIPPSSSSSSDPPSSSSSRYPMSKPSTLLGSNGYAPIGRSTSNANPFDEDHDEDDRSRVSNPFADDEEEVEVPLNNQRRPLPHQPTTTAVSPVHAPKYPPYPPPSHPPPGPPPPRPPPGPPPGPPPRSSSTSGVEMTPIIPIASRHLQQDKDKQERDKKRSEQSRNQLKKHLHKIEKHVEKNSSDPNSAGHPMALTGEDENAVIRFLVAKRDGTISSNYRQYVYNNHPLLSLILLHPLNPYGRKERLIVFINSLFFAIFVTFVILETTYVPKIATCRLGCNREIVVTNSTDPSSTADSFNPISPTLLVSILNNSTTTIITDQCVGGYNDGLSYTKYHEICSRYEPWMLSAICGAFIVVYQSFMEFCATCGCMQGQRFFETNCLGNRCKSVVEWCGGTILTFFTAVSVILLLWAVIACYVLGADYSLFSGILLSKVWSVGEWFIWSAPYFSYKYPLDRRRFLKKMRKKYGSPPPSDQGNNNAQEEGHESVIEEQGNV